MADLVVRPTLKFIQTAYIAVLVIVLAGFVAQHYYLPKWPLWTPLVLAALLVWVFTRHLRRMAVKLTIGTEKLTYEEGLLGKSTRTIQLAKVQDVRVDQSLFDRMFGVGRLSVETAGGSSRLTMAPIDRPHQIADEITNRSEQAMAAKPGV
ncbi:MAG TPA: PH domain-containing protein [Bryobacteraceae bacterium]|nr:PH domain-containing protein [Bryobacteraceae bacterium]